MILSAHQPGYLPWLGYFDKIKRSNLFIFMDTVQLTNSSTINFITRNFIKTSQGPLLLTVPIKRKGFMNKSIIDLEIDYSQNWIKKHLRSIELNYRKAINFDQLQPKIEEIYNKEYNNFSDFCFYQLEFYLKELKIDTEVKRLSEINTKEKKSDLILEICRHYKADKYIAGGKSMDYLNKEEFKNLDIEIILQNFIHPKYVQLFGGFEENMGIIDFLMNTQNLEEFNY